MRETLMCWLKYAFIMETKYCGLDNGDKICMVHMCVV